MLQEAPPDLFDFANADPFVVFGQSRPVRVMSAEVEQQTVYDDTFTTLEDNPRLRARRYTVPTTGNSRYDLDSCSGVCHENGAYFCADNDLIFSQTIPQHQSARNPLRITSSSSVPEGRNLPTLHENNDNSSHEKQRHRYLPYIPRNGRRERKG